ncbi:hypothetical protein [Ancylobacter lacus]|uniref:hypothetical protein n=1 Tax=Ancylobacter lacus TaxID=2579970 RepID=UPI001BCFC78E|nr:hypothetical protein [Ancylobacter lacus]MBS7538534.1 hypothetical protein [Ancylobacter lacus]
MPLNAHARRPRALLTVAVLAAGVLAIHLFGHALGEVGSGALLAATLMLARGVFLRLDPTWRHRRREA